MDGPDELVNDTVALVEHLNDLGYVIGRGSVVVHADDTVTFWLGERSQTFIDDLADLGFRHPYEVKFDPLMLRPILPRD